MRCAVLKHTGKNMNLESQIKQLIIDSLGLEDINHAFDLMHEGKSIRSVLHYAPTAKETAA